MSDLWGRTHGHTLKRKRPDTNFDIAIDSDSQDDHLKRQNIDDGHDAIDLTPSHQIPEVIGSAATESTQKTTSTGVYRPTQLPAPQLGHSPSAVPKPSPSQSSQTIRAQQHRPTISSKQSTSAPKPQFTQQCTPTSSSQSSNLLTSLSKRSCAISELENSGASDQPDKLNDQGKGVQTWKPNEWDDDEFDSDEESMSLAVTMKLANELSLLKSFLDLYRKFNIHLGGKQSLDTNTRLTLTY